MEQRALLVSALMLGCATAAGAGGFLAMRQTAPTPTAAATATLPAVPADDAVVEGTVAEIGPPTPAVPPAGPEGRVKVETEAPRTIRTPAVDPVSRVASRPASAPIGVPVGAPVGVPARPAPVAAATPAAGPPAQAPVQISTPSTDSARTGNEWPARETTAAPPNRAADRDAGATIASAESMPSRAAVDEVSTPPPPVRRLETVTIPADAVIGVQLESSVSSLSARVEDTVRARVTRDLLSGGEVVVPAGARLVGSVTLVEEGGRVRERARLGIRFHTLILADGTEVKLPTETIYREGESPAGRSAAKIGGATVGGAILGAIMGGGKGAVIGAATGAGSGTGWAMAGERRPAELRSGQSVTVRVSDSVSSQVER